MMFQANDMVEIVVGPSEIARDCQARPGMRGTVTGFLHHRLKAFNGFAFGEVAVWSCTFNGVDVQADEDAIRKVPPDPGRELVRWDQVDWKPGRSLVEA